MKGTIHVIICDEEHGTGDQYFPDIRTGDDLRQFVDMPLSKVKRLAKEAGWTVGKLTLCDLCNEMNREREADQ